MIECLLTKILVLLVAAIASYSSGAPGDYAVARPGCQDECGGVKIPFPFGIGDGCYFINLDYLETPTNTFEIVCDNTTNSKPIIQSLENREVLNISLEDHSLLVSSEVAYNCSTTSSSTTTVYYGVPGYIFSVPLIIMSSTRNKFVSVGCDTTSSVRGSLESDRATPIVDAATCMTSCDNLDLVRDGTCDSLLGCCEASISRNFTNPSVYVGSSPPGIWNLTCSYAFIGEVGSYNFFATNLTATETNCRNFRVPVVYDWFMHVKGYANCSEAKENGREEMNCSSNSMLKCVDISVDYNVPQEYFILTCHCLEGYNGNPYLQSGCQDINECAEKRLNECERREYCVNKKGGYECRCPDGLHGNATTTSPCVNPAPVAHGSGKLSLGVTIGMGSMTGFILLIYGLYKIIKRKKEINEREHNFKKNGGLLLQQEMSTNEGAIDRTKIFSRSELEKATDNFNDNRILGRGGQGTVYKGMLVDGTIVAVKKSKKVDENQLAQFINEVAILSQINHRNVVKLFGCCLETDVPLLVYEFVSNGTLYQHIHHPGEDFHLSWNVRFQIVVECAGAIAYLHSSCSSPIYHRDIKSSNILLDEKYRAKVSDFGTSRTISIDKTHVTTCVQGTFGYLDPEFFRSSQFNEKSDVYSFGVVLLELLTSKKPIFTNTCGEPRGLATEFVQIMETSPNQLHEILDTQVLQHCSEEEIEELTKLIERCLSMNGRERPTMKEVAMALETIKSQQDKEGNHVAGLEINGEERHEMNMTSENASINSITSTISLPR